MDVTDVEGRPEKKGKEEEGVKEEPNVTNTSTHLEIVMGMQIYLVRRWNDV